MGPSPPTRGPQGAALDWPEPQTRSRKTVQEPLRFDSSQLLEGTVGCFLAEPSKRSLGDSSSLTWSGQVQARPKPPCHRPLPASAQVCMHPPGIPAKFKAVFLPPSPLGLACQDWLPGLLTGLGLEAVHTPVSKGGLVFFWLG